MIPKKPINKATPPDYYPGIDDPLPWHPYASLFPECTEEEMADLVESIRNHGQFEPATIYQGQILDGRHREAAIAILNQENKAQGKPLIRLIYGIFQGDKTGPYYERQALLFVQTQNLIRRNCNFSKSQRAAIALAIEEEFAKIAKKAEISANFSIAQPGAIENKSSFKAAQAHGISPRTVQMIKTVKKEDPGLFQEVLGGKLTVNAAYRQVKPPKKEPEQQPLPLPDPKKLETNPDEIIIGFVSNLPFIQSDRLLMVLNRISEEHPEILNQFLATYEKT